MSNLMDLGFDANQVEPNAGFDAIPAGEYDAVIVSSEVKPTSRGDGRYLKLECQILNGPHQNRKVFTNLNLWNPSAEAVQIARGTLSAICRAINVLTPQDSSQLHNKPLRIKVTVKQDPDRGPQNEIKAFKPRQAGGVPTPPPGHDPNNAMAPQNAPQGGQPVAAGSGTPSW